MSESMGYAVVYIAMQWGIMITNHVFPMVFPQILSVFHGCPLDLAFLLFFSMGFPQSCCKSSHLVSEIVVLQLQVGHFGLAKQGLES
jgi:hypothetical protein